MNASPGFTGIHVHAGIKYWKEAGAALRATGHAMAGVVHALHLEETARAAWRQTKIRIALDGAMLPEEPLFTGHFVACAPGDHRLDITWHTPSMMGQEKQASLHAQAASVRVEPGRVTQVLYYARRVPMPSEIHVLGTRPAGDLLPGAGVNVVWDDGRQLPARVLQSVPEYTLVELADGSRQWVPDVTVRVD